VRGTQIQLFGAAFVTAGGGGVFNVLDNSLGNTLSRSRGDTNLHRDQGQITIEANSISDTQQVGILVDNGQRDASGNPHPASVRNVPTLNLNRVVPGVLIENNLVVNSGQAGIRISGQATDLTQPLASVPFVRGLNNTVYGNASRTGIGIDVVENASPTLLNNLVSNLAIGISVDPSSQTTVTGQNMFDNNGQNNVGFALDAGDIVTVPGEPVFVNAAARNFYPASIPDPLDPNGVIASQAIDSSINSLPQRADLAAVSQPLGIPESPILAPELDLLGIERVDDPDVESPPGSGSDVFKDRGAIDRADFDGPLAVLANPVDNVPPDTHADVNRVVLPPGQTLLNFTVQFVDTNGSGIDNSTVDTTKFTLKRNGVTLVDGTHYIFSYDRTNKLVRFIPVQGLWLPGSVFEITIVNNDSDPLKPGIKDLAQNLLEPNSANLETKFTIVLPSSALPDVAVSPATITVPEGNIGATNKAVFTITLAGVSAVDTVVNFATANGNNPAPTTKNATAGQDYVARTGSVTFAPGETSKTVEVDIIGDTQDEDNEEFRLNLSLPGGTPNATISTATGVATILDDDNPNITIANATIVEGDAPGTTNLVFTVTLSTAPTLPVTVDYTTASAGVGETFAVAGVDYTTTSGLLTIPAGATSIKI
jgi:parallel beta-helix repeat protein